MKKLMLFISTVAIITAFSPNAFAHFKHWDDHDASGDYQHKSFGDGYSYEMKQIEDGFIIFPGLEIGVGSGTLSGSLGVNVGYKIGHFLVGTSLRGQVVNIDKVNYQFIPYTINICGLSYSVIPETSNSINDKKLKGWALGYAVGGKFTFGQMVETDPNTDEEREFLTMNFGFGF